MCVCVCVSVRRAEQGLKEIWTLVAELDANMQFKSIANALLDPVALRSVSVVHSKVRCCMLPKPCDQEYYQRALKSDVRFW